MKGSDWKDNIYPSLEFLEKIREHIQENEKLFSSISSNPAFQQARMLQEKIRNIPEAPANFQSIEQLTKRDLNAAVLKKALDQIRQAVTSPHILKVDQLQQLSESTQDMIAYTLPNLETMASMSAAFAKVSKSHDAFSNLLPEYNLLKLAAFRTAEIQVLIGGVIDSSSEISELYKPLSTSLSSLSASSAFIWSSFASKSVSLQTLPKWLLEAPIIQTYQASRNVAQIINIEEEIEEEIEESITLHNERGDVLGLLENLGSEFSSIFIGAKEAVIYKRQDYVRHASVSLRELLDKLLEHLAPTEVVQKWTESADLLQKRQIHKARLKYLFRELSYGSYTDFIEKDIELILQTFYALNKGTHTLSSPFTDKTMSVLMARVEGHLLMILTAANL
ncbi:hypothetical protein K9N68_16455 [Kovacikia minuta CCNUW1]|uniref:pPIWI-associating nuclease domain-containing protein n=1 Tax=Kovacikia minuta TaxID=2931930 RepID=UPI001CCBAEC8|nr:hypothetical protein [Kovacikia minuta]UBF29278.1 hypothetical protein K9N68_16455 [Kovacikia minuta CCNUW1]